MNLKDDLFHPLIPLLYRQGNNMQGGCVKQGSAWETEPIWYALLRGAMGWIVTPAFCPNYDEF